ncbi:MAG: transketolase C-terminal domain-containing protein, partial [Anaerolineales bacterium]
GMGAALNGMNLFGGVIAYGGTFMVFSDYMKPAIRIAAISGIPSIFVFTHDSVGLGEDGPTHQPIEHLMALRATPHLTVIRPADANEVVDAWKVALTHTAGPTVLALTRQNVPTLEGTDRGLLSKGAYVLKDFGKKPRFILMASGSEVSLIYGAAEKLFAEGVAVRVVSFPSWELFEAQDESYRESVLPKKVTRRLAVEAGATLGWERYATSVLGLDHYGASAPYKGIFENFGFTVENVFAKAKELL